MAKKTRLRDLMPTKTGYQPSQVRNPGAQIRKPIAPVKPIRARPMRRAKRSY